MELKTETKSKVRAALVELVFSQIKTLIRPSDIDTDIEEFADTVIEYIAYETTDDRAMDLAEEISEKLTRKR